jgi:AcrR family transcriptional regulator
VAKRAQRPRRRLTKDERRGRLLEAAAAIFSERGYEGASIEAIAGRAEITKPVVYDHFGSKRELYVALLELYTAELFASLGRRVADIGEGSNADRFAAAIDAFFEFVETHPTAWRILFRDAPSEPEVAAAVARLQSQATTALVMLLAARPAVAHPRDPEGFELVTEREMAAELVKGATIGLAAWWYEHRDVSREHLVYVTMNALWIGFDRFAAGTRWEGPGRDT